MALTLPELRVQIDALDLELLNLLNRRAALAEQVTALTTERDTLAGQGSDSGSLFGTDVPVRKRSHGKGLADHIFMKGKLKEWDRAGGGLNLCESFVTVSRAA